MTKNQLFKNLMLLCLPVAFGITHALASTIVVSGNITTNTTWTNKNIYILSGQVYVVSPAILTINAGTLIEGDSATKGSLIITRGAKITAIGTTCQPVVFTSEKPSGLRKRGDWGGVILEGFAPVNWPGDTGHIEGITPNPLTLYGGGKNPNCGGGDCPNAHDNSGTMEYVRIEFAGVALSPNNEINGLTFGGVGDGTVINHIQVSYSNDDSYEWFGGTVNCKYMIAYDGIDDDWDTDNGFSGKVQFGLSMRDPNVADVSGSKSFESDNDPNGDNALPQTLAQFENITSLGGAEENINPLFTASAHIRRNSWLKIYNSIMMGWLNEAILIDGSNTIANEASDASVKNCYVQQKEGTYLVFTPLGDPNIPQATTNLTGNGNKYSTQYNGVLVNANFPITNVSNVIPASGNPLQAANQSLYGTDPFWTKVTYLGAFNPAGDTWAGDWTNFDPVNTTYNGAINITPTVSLVTNTSVICPNSGAIDINVTKGVTPYLYSWSNGAMTQDISGLAAGSYSVVVSDAGGACQVNKSYTVKTTKPLLTGCLSSNSNSITVGWSGSISGSVTGYQLRDKLHTAQNYGPWFSAGDGTSFVITGLLANSSYDIELRGNCTSGNTSASKPITCGTTASRMGDEASAATVVAYPNPTNGKFTVQLNGFNANATLMMRVTNMYGQIVYNNSAISSDQSSVDVDLANAASGIYHVEVTDGTNNITQNIVLNK